MENHRVWSGIGSGFKVRAPHQKTLGSSPWSSILTASVAAYICLERFAICKTSFEKKKNESSILLMQFNSACEYVNNILE